MVTGSEARLWELIEARTHTDADVDAIDARIWELFGEEWAVMFTDLVGFSRHAAKFGIIHFLQIIHEQHQLLLPIISDGSGFLVKSEGDSYIVLFRSVRRAIECAVAMQRACQMASARRVDEEKILLCVGIGYGRILRVGEHEVWGTEVNAASRLGEDTARADQILVTSGAREAAGTMDGIEFQAIDAVAAGSVSNFEVRY
ncbi:MAG TPA: adenylate/guanylate cyclase domain-containing protein [Kofleriaceae bacterium]|nr:adenylate/guanylate cyclase domain-containing protein [Kofleriaceae bacterium]